MRVRSGEADELYGEKNYGQKSRKGRVENWVVIQNDDHQELTIGCAPGLLRGIAPPAILASMAHQHEFKVDVCVDGEVRVCFPDPVVRR
jgi:hypothetical protein